MRFARANLLINKWLQKKYSRRTRRLLQYDTRVSRNAVSIRYVRPLRARKLLVVPSLASIEISHP